MAKKLLMMLFTLLVPTTGLNLNMGRRSVAMGAGVAAIGLRPAEVKADPAKAYDDDCISKCCAKLQNINKGIGKVEYITRVEAIAQCKPQCKKAKQ
jgi:hypothetical protein